MAKSARGKTGKFYLQKKKIVRLVQLEMVEESGANQDEVEEIIGGLVKLPKLQIIELNKLLKKTRKGHREIELRIE